MLQHFTQKIFAFLPSCGEKKTPADYLQDFHNSLTSPSGFLARRAVEIKTLRGEITTSTYDETKAWKGHSMRDLHQMMKERKLVSSSFSLEEFALRMRHGEYAQLILKSSSDTTEYPMYRLNKKQVRLACKAGVKRKYPSFYDRSTEPHKGDFVIDGVLYAPDTMSLDFVVIND